MALWNRALRGELRLNIDLKRLKETQLGWIPWVSVGVCSGESLSYWLQFCWLAGGFETLSLGGGTYLSCNSICDKISCQFFLQLKSQP